MCPSEACASLDILAQCLLVFHVQRTVSQKQGNFGAETPASLQISWEIVYQQRQVVLIFSLEPNPPGTPKPRYTPSHRNIMAKQELKEISKAELAKHNTKEDLWFIIHNKVYDVTKYQTEHPGGIDVLMQFAADDASEIFEATSLSDEARKKLDKLIVGQLPCKDQEDDVEVFHKVYPDTHNPDRKPLGKEIFALFLGLTGLVAFCTSKVSARYHLVLVGVRLARAGACIARALTPCTPRRRACIQYTQLRGTTHVPLPSLVCSLSLT